MGAATSGWITEIRYLYLQMMIRPLTPQAQALWHFLMQKANAIFWEFPLVMRAEELAGGCGMSLTTFKRIRAELAEKRYILWESQGSNRPAHYYVFSNVHPNRLLRAPWQEVEKNGLKPVNMATKQARQESANTTLQKVTAEGAWLEMERQEKEIKRTGMLAICTPEDEEETVPVLPVADDGKVVPFPAEAVPAAPEPEPPADDDGEGSHYFAERYGRRKTRSDSSGP